MSRGLAAALGIGLLGLGCAASQLAPLPWQTAPPARLSVEVLHGFARPLPPTDEEERVELLVDVTASMKAATPAGVSRAEAARVAASRLVAELPASASIGLTALGTRTGGCRAPQALEYSQPGQSRDKLQDQISSLQSVGEGSLAAGLDVLTAGLAGQAPSWRVVVFTDLGQECGGDLCSAVAALVGAGARIDLVVVGDTPAPACVTDFVLGDRPPLGDGARAPHFRVEGEAEGGTVVLARGLSGGPAVDVPSGSARVIVELDPPARIGPLLLSPDAETHIRVLDFPQLEPRVREWRWDTRPLAVAHEAP